MVTDRTLPEDRSTLKDCLLWILFPNSITGRKIKHLGHQLSRNHSWIWISLSVFVFAGAAYIGTYSAYIEYYKILLGRCPPEQTTLSPKQFEQCYDANGHYRTAPLYARLWIQAPVTLQDSLIEPCLFASWITGGPPPRVAVNGVFKLVHQTGLKLENVRFVANLLARCIPLLLATVFTRKGSLLATSSILPLVVGLAIQEQLPHPIPNIARVTRVLVEANIQSTIQTRLAAEVLVPAFPRGCGFLSRRRGPSDSDGRSFRSHVYTTGFAFILQPSVDLWTGWLVFLFVLEYTFLIPLLAVVFGWDLDVEVAEYFERWNERLRTSST